MNGPGILTYGALLVALGSGGLVQTARQFLSERQIASHGAIAPERSDLRPVSDEVVRHHERLAGMSHSAAPELAHRLSRATLMKTVFLRGEERRVALCQAHRAALRAVQLSPANANYRIAVGAVASDLSREGVNCFPDGARQPDEHLELAQSLAPQRPEELYLISLAYLGHGAKDKALGILQTVQEIDPQFTAEQRRYVQDLIGTDGELRLAIPRRYPEVVAWLHEFAARHPLKYRVWRSVFGEALTESVAELESRFASKALPEFLYRAYLKTIADLAVTGETSPLRRRLDRTLGHLYRAEGNLTWGKILAERSVLDRVPVLKSMIADDRQPTQGMLARWFADGDEVSVTLDSPGQSVGVYVPPGFSPSLILLQSEDEVGKLKPDAVEIYGSEDNLAYNRLHLSLGMERLLVDGRETFVLRFPSPPPPFVKIHLRESSQRAYYRNRFSNLVQVYGRR